MRLNADADQRIVIDTTSMTWTPSPIEGVDRKMLDRIGEEVARATSLVRYAPNSAFSPHVHGGGEEFLVLEGVFSDEHGDFGPGSYIRNPPGSSHTPRSEPGSIIFVKLWQMQPDDLETVRIDTESAAWTEGSVEGVRVLLLADRTYERVTLERWAPGVFPGERIYPKGAEILVLNGAFDDETGSHEKGAWLRFPAGARHTPSSPEGCRFYIKTGHLAEPLRAPDV